MNLNLHENQLGGESPRMFEKLPIELLQDEPRACVGGTHAHVAEIYIYFVYIHLSVLSHLRDRFDPDGAP